MNCELNMIILLIFRFSAILSLKHCFPHMRRVCITCKNTPMNSLNCVNDLNQEINVYFAKNDTIDYTSFINTNTKMIQEPEKLTFYSCSPNVIYFQVNPYNFYPINEQLLLPSDNDMPPNSINSQMFQNCLQTYCLSINNNKLTCVNNFLDTLDFQFSDTVTPECINNITYVLIYSRILFKIDPTKLFHYAPNIVYLKMDHEYIYSKTFKCNSFKNLHNLRFVEIQLDSFNDQSLTYDCVFQSNPSLILIRINNETVWNPCNTSRSSHTTFIVATVTIMIITVVIVIVATYFYYRRFNRNRLSVLFDNIPLNNINIEIMNNFQPVPV